MSKTVQWGIDKKRDRGILKMMGLIINMIQDHDVNEYHMIGGKERTLLSIHNELKAIYESGAYTISERDFLNRVRSLVLSYQNTKKGLPWENNPSYEGLPFFINSKGQINHNLTTLSNGVR